MWRTLRSVAQFRARERDPDLRRLRTAANLDDLRAIDRKSVV